MNEPNIFQGVLLLSDIDGTLYNRQKEIPPRNIDAIRRFMELGGLFAIASGRNPKSVLPAAVAADVNCPCITLNGAMVYDFEKNEPVVQCTLPPTYINLIARLRTDFPTLGIQTYVGGCIHNAFSNDVVENLLRIEHQQLCEPEHSISCADTQLPTEPLNKILLGGSPELLKQVREAVENRYGDIMTGMKPLMTEVMYYEILPQDADKGTGAIALAKHCGIPASRIAAVGDYYNDIEMLAAANLSMVASNAPEEIRVTVDFVCGDCDDGAVADAIDHMEALIRAGAW